MSEYLLTDVRVFNIPIKDVCRQAGISLLTYYQSAA